MNRFARESKFSHKINNFEELLEAVKKEFADRLRVNLNIEPFSANERMRRIKKREELRRALRKCGSGDEASKIFVKEAIKRMLIGSFGINEENIHFFIIENSEYKFKILLAENAKKYENEGLENLLGNLFIKDKGEITKDEVNHLYEERGIYKEEYPIRMEYLCQKIYESYRGNGVIDELLNFRIDGISGGVSGGEGFFFVWVMYKGVTIRLSFLTFEGEREIKRICRNLCRGYGVGQLSEKRGFIVSELSDGSRISIARPPFCETWSFFIRKFRTDHFLEIEDMIKGEGSEKVIALLLYLIRGERLFAITGEQGSGKTSLLAALIGFIPKHLNLRVSEMSFELHLRHRYPERNIVSYRETDSVGLQEGLDFTKKTDGNVTILGEVASMKAVLFLVQLAQNASSFTLFTHHAKDSKTLIHYFRNALLMQGNFSNEQVALIQAVQAIQIHIHLAKSPDGERYIERISEIIPHDGEAGFYEKELVVRTSKGYRIKNEVSEATKEAIYKKLTKNKEVEEFFALSAKR